jgi:hypothetical protein
MVKKLAGFAIIFIMVLEGCTNDNIVNPLENSIADKKYKSSSILLPQTIKAEVGLIYSASNIINGIKGGSVVIDTSYMSPSGKVKICAQVKFKSNSFSGTHLVSMMIDNISGTVSFDPPSVFARPADFDMKLEGLDLSGVNASQVGFVYINPNGELESVQCQEMIIDIPGKILEVKDAELHHFSRYGWAR